ncbi:MAG: hypothetical protein JKX98_07080 [Alcanivoracaceae bacterium]|nr:hypothetical protein [Alcanivoracaceae bacterium]
MKRSDIKNIRLKLVVPFVASLLIILFTNQWNLYLFQKYGQKEFTKLVSAQLKKDFNQAIKDDVKIFESSLYFISQDKLLQSYWLNGNRIGLMSASLPIFDKLKHDHQITHFNYLGLNSFNVLRVHKPKQNGDRINRSSLNIAIKTENISTDIELGVFGQFVLRVVIPWKINGKLVGYLELGKDIDHILKKISTMNHYDLVLTVNKEYLLKNKLDKVENFANNIDEFTQYKRIFTRLSQQIEATEPTTALTFCY